VKKTTDDVISRPRDESISEGKHAGRLHGSAAQARRSHARAMPDLIPDEPADERRRETPMFKSLGAGTSPTSTALSEYLFEFINVSAVPLLRTL